MSNWETKLKTKYLINVSNLVYSVCPSVKFDKSTDELGFQYGFRLTPKLDSYSSGQLNLDCDFSMLFDLMH